jgi:hypothetical protein
VQNDWKGQRGKGAASEPRPRTPSRRARCREQHVLVCRTEVAPFSLLDTISFFITDSSFFVTDPSFSWEPGGDRGRGNCELVSHEGTTPDPAPYRTRGERGTSGLGVLRHTLGHGVLTRTTARDGVMLGKTEGRGWKRCGPRVFWRRPSHVTRGPSAEIYLDNFPFFISYQNAYHRREVITRGDGESRRMRDVTRELAG